MSDATLKGRTSRNEAAEAIKQCFRRQGAQFMFSQNNYARYTDLIVSADMGYQLDVLALQAITVKYRVSIEVSYNVVIDQRWRIRMRSGEPSLHYRYDGSLPLAFHPYGGHHA